MGEKSDIKYEMKIPKFGHEKLVDGKFEFDHDNLENKMPQIDLDVKAKTELDENNAKVKGDFDKSGLSFGIKMPDFDIKPTNIGGMEGPAVESKVERDDRMKFPVIGMAYTDIKQSDVKVNEYDITTDGKIKTKTVKAPNIESLQIKSKDGDIPTFGRESTISGSIPESSIGPDQPRLT